MKLYWLLIFVPLAIGARLLNLNPTIVFVLSFLAMIPLASLISEAVDVLAIYAGPSMGALLSATFGTLTEIFILFNLLWQGQIAVMPLTEDAKEAEPSASPDLRAKPMVAKTMPVNRRPMVHSE